MSQAETPSRPPDLAALLGYAGLLPQAAAAAVLAFGSPWWHFAALSLGFAYAALILSFLGGMWWGLSARSTPAPPWIWIAAVAPSLVALATTVPWAIGANWPVPSLVVLGLSLLLSLLVDRQLARADIAPAWWMALRIPLSVGLGLLTLAIAALA